MFDAFVGSWQPATKGIYLALALGYSTPDVSTGPQGYPMLEILTWGCSKLATLALRPGQPRILSAILTPNRAAHKLRVLTWGLPQARWATRSTTYPP